MTPDPKPGSRPAPDLHRRRPVIVCVDDELPILRALARVLREEAYELLLTQDPGQALDWIRTREVSIVIADYRMPHMTGAELLANLEEGSPDTRKVLFTGHPGESVILRGREQGAFTLVEKPWNDEKLKAVIRSELQKREASRPP